jgi:hypothetical protein
MNGEQEPRPRFLTRFSPTQIAVAGMVGAVILVVLLIATASIT